MLSGLGALGFWLFIAATIVAAIWFAIRDREARHATLRKMIESGQPVDKALFDRLFADGGGRLDSHLMMFGLITLFLAVGLGFFGLLVSFQAPAFLYPMLAVATLAGFAAIGLMAASSAVRRRDDENGPRDRDGA